MAEILHKVIEENRQGEAFAPFAEDPNGYNKKFYIESYGCQTNFSDTEIVASHLHAEGFCTTQTSDVAQLLFI